MPLRFNSAPPATFYDVLETKIGCQWTIRIGIDKSFWLSCDLHWLPAQRRTVPCLQEDCPWCHLPGRPTTFVPIEVYFSVTRKWKGFILSCTRKMLPLIEGSIDGRVFEISRYGRDNAPIQWKELEQHRSNLVFRGFDLQPSLKRMWGEYVNYKVVRPRIADESGAA